MMNEYWKAIPDYDGFYEASNFGNIRSIERTVLKKDGKLNKIKSRLIKQHLQNSGYKIVGLCKNGKIKTSLVHRLIGYTFLDLTKDKIIDHIDGDKLNNRRTNLRVCTKRENSSFDNRKVTATRKSIFVGVDWHKNKWRAAIRINGKKVYLGSFINEIEASNAYQSKLKEINQILATK